MKITSLQMMIIWKAMIEYLYNNLRQGKSVNIKRFGSFTYDIETELPRIATKSINPKTDLDD
jgi:nucleoid DNA-binding protein